VRVVASTSAVPASDEEFLRQYRGYVVQLVRTQGIPAQDAEDVADDILLAELQAKNRAGEPVGILALYDPEHQAEHYGVSKRVSFKAFLSARVVLRCRGRRDAVQRRAYREIPASGSDARDWAEVFGLAAWDDYSNLDAEEFVARMRQHLARMPRRSPSDSCDLVALFDELVIQARETGYVSNAAVRVKFGIGDTTATAWINRLREIMRQAGEDLPAPESHIVGGVKLSLTDLRSAVSILQGARGIMVRQPLDRAGHPLAQAEKGWYHLFAREEIKSFPEIAIDPQTHRKPAGHVKIAVLHRLERMLGVALADSQAPADNPRQSAGSSPVTAPDEPEEPLTEWEVTEARLWSAGLKDPGMMLEIRSWWEESRSAPVTVA
jgi:hypothetical protein